MKIMNGVNRYFNMYIFITSGLNITAGEHFIAQHNFLHISQFCIGIYV